MQEEGGTMSVKAYNVFMNVMTVLFLGATATVIGMSVYRLLFS